MSGTISGVLPAALSGALSSGSGFSLAGIAFSATGVVSVGSFVAYGMENPEKLRFGGKQQVVVHKLLGGDRIVDVLGPDEDDVAWTGYLTGALAQVRAIQLDEIRKAGETVPLVWPGGYRQAIVTEFSVSVERAGYLLPYSIKCLVLPLTTSSSGDFLSSSASYGGSSVGTGTDVTSLNQQTANDASTGVSVGQAAQAKSTFANGTDTSAVAIA